MKRSVWICYPFLTHILWNTFNADLINSINDAMLLVSLNFIFGFFLKKIIFGFLRKNGWVLEKQKQIFRSTVSVTLCTCFKFWAKDWCKEWAWDPLTALRHLMAYLHCRVRIPIPIRTANKIATLYYVHLFTLHRVGFRFQSWLSIIWMGSESGSESESGLKVWCSVVWRIYFCRQIWTTRTFGVAGHWTIFPWTDV